MVEVGLPIRDGDGEPRRDALTGPQLDADLRQAIDRGEIEVVFQPQFALVDGPGARAIGGSERLSGAEALARWNHPMQGRIGAAVLFAIADRTDQIIPLSRHIAHIALTQAHRWPGHLRLSLNITPAELALPDIAADMRDAWRRSGFSPHRLTLEVTEQSLIADLARAAGALGELARHGVRIALDDFGAGYCNFQYLKMLPLHYLKLDRAMVDNIVEDPRDLAVLRAIVTMARALGLEVIAEGVENQAQADIVAQEGCGYLQGFLRAQPIAAAEFLELADDCGAM